MAFTTLTPLATPSTKQTQALLDACPTKLGSNRPSRPCHHLGLHDTKSPGILRAIGKRRLGGPS
jgi:hypothetical protein